MAVKWCVKAALLLLISSPMTVYALVSCSVATSGVAFGNYEQLNPANTISMGTADITCSDIGGAGALNVTLAVAISASATSGTVATRQMVLAGGAERLNYNLYRDAALTLVWGDTPGIDDLTLPKLKVPNNGTISTTVTIYGGIPPGQDVYAGSYSDNNVLTIFY